MGVEKDIFDRIMERKIFAPLMPIYTKYKEFILYAFFGGFTFLVSIISFLVFNTFFGMNELIANVWSWIASVLFAFFTNRVWVFNSPTNSAEEFIKQMVSFCAGRFVTLVIEEIILFVFITMYGYPDMIVKIMAQIIVIATNYVISKLVVFRTRETA